MKNYTFAYHQLKFVSLLSTVYIHSISFLNQQYQLHLEKVVDIHFLFLFATMSTYFVALAGVSFYLSLQEQIKSGRLQNFVFGKIGLYLLILMLIETVKNSLVFESPASLFHWDFLKFIFVCYLLVATLSRLHIIWNLVVALAIAFTQKPIQEIADLFRQTTVPQIVQSYPDLYNNAHAHYFAFLLFFTLLTIFVLIRSSVPRNGKYFFTLVILGFSYYAWEGFLSKPVTPKDYLSIVNWWIDGISPPQGRTIFYPLSIWIPSALISFYLCHYRAALKSLYEKFRYPAIIILTIMNFLFYLHYSKTDLFSFKGLINIWDAKNFAGTSPAHELFKIALPVNLFLVLSELNRALNWGKDKSLIYKFSISSFLIYLVSTSWTVWLVVQIELRLSFYMSLLVILTSTAVISWLVAQIGFFFWSKKISIEFARTR